MSYEPFSRHDRAMSILGSEHLLLLRANPHKIKPTKDLGLTKPLEVWPICEDIKLLTIAGGYSFWGTGCLYVARAPGSNFNKTSFSR